LFLSLKREIQGSSRKHRKRLEAVEKRLSEAWQSGPGEETSLPPLPPAPFPLRPGFNLNKRVHAVRMLRRGKDVGHIAAALGVPRKEVELLIRVHGATRAAGS
jgi:hypothetical protein